MLRSAGRSARELEADTGPFQGLYRAAQDQHVPVAAFDGDWTARAANGSADPYARDARGRGTRDRGALELQRGRRSHAIARHRAFRMAAAADRVAAEPQRPAGISVDGQGRPFRRRGFRVYAQG